MGLPFTAEQFLAVIARYNQAIWPLHLIVRERGGHHAHADTPREKGDRHGNAGTAVQSS